MTALRYDKPTESALRKAGMIFGLDLASLFDKEDDDDEAYSDFAPGVEFEKTTKGKGGGLYMRPQPVTGETTRLKFLPREAQILSPSEISINLSAPPIQQLANQMEEKEEEKEELLDRTLASFIGSGSGSAIGAQGIGRAQQYGYSDADIRAMAKQEGLKFGENAARSLGLNTELTSAKGGEGTTEGALGASAVQRLRDRGLADEAIVSLARQQGLKFGEAAGQQLGVGQDLMYQAPKAAAPSGGGGANLGQAAREIKQTFGSSSPQYSGGGGIGEAGIEKMARARGITFAQARDQARSAGLTIGAKAAAR